MAFDLKSYVRARLQDVPQDWARTPEVVAAAARTHVLPLLADWSGYFGLLEDGSLVGVYYNKPRVEPQSDEFIRNVALFRGSRRYPELSELVPRRGPHDKTCPDCGGSGIDPCSVRVEFRNSVCFCGGLGWIPKAAQSSLK